MKKRRLLLSVVAALGFTTTTIAQVPSYVPTNGLVGWWPFNSNANDESGNGNNGTVNGVTLTNDRFGNPNSAYSFDGVDDQIEVINSSSLNFGVNPTFTLSFWLNKSNTLSGGVICKAVPSNGFGWNGWNFINDDFQTGYPCLNNNIVIAQNVWEFILLIVDNGTIYKYVNNQFFGQHTCQQITTNSISTTQNMYLGVDRDIANYLLGQLDDIGIWNRALTQQEITDLYNGCQLSVNTQPTNQTVNINNNAQFVVSSSDPGATYQWQTDLGVGFQNLNNVGQYSGTTTNTLNVSNVTMSNNNQPFRCIISSGSCTDTSNVAVLTVNNNVGINEVSQSNLFSVYPNPAKSQINVKADAQLLGSIYTVYDNTGKLVLSGKIISENTTIELGNLSGGIYMFSVGENMKQTFKVIKE
jgi:hypothetical protein